jgi:hypothetical protein
MSFVKLIYLLTISAIIYGTHVVYNEVDMYQYTKPIAEVFFDIEEEDLDKKSNNSGK